MTLYQLLALETLTADCRYVGVNLTPSMNMATGANKMKDMTVIIEKRVMLSIDSCSKQSDSIRPIPKKQ